jgi:predicted HicB family RNase H-like nuclease
MDTLQYKNYYGSVEYDQDHKCYCGKVLGMELDSITYEGNTVEELEVDFKASIESYLEGCKELGVKPRKGYNGTLSIRISPAIYTQIATYAENQNIKIATLIRNSLKRQFQTAN